MLRSKVDHPNKPHYVFPNVVEIKVSEVHQLRPHFRQIDCAYHSSIEKIVGLRYALIQYKPSSVEASMTTSSIPVFLPPF